MTTTTSKFLVSVILAIIAMFSTCNELVAQPASCTETPKQFKNANSPQSKMLDRLLRYLKVESQSIDDPDPTTFPMTEGQRLIARQIYEEVKGFGGKDVNVVLSDDYYVYIDIPSNLQKQTVPSILFLAHCDVTPEANGKSINPQVHFNYNGGVIILSDGVTLSPNTPQGTHLKDLVGKTVVTSDGSTLLGADCKTGCAVLITLVEELLSNPKCKHGRVMFCLSQNEDIGRAADRYSAEVFGVRPDIVIDVDGDTYDQFSVANFTAECQTYLFHGNLSHPSHGKENGYADALTASAYFVGLLPPSLHPSASAGREGYVHCYSLTHPTDSLGRSIESDYVLKVRLRYFQPEDGNYQRQLLADNLRKAQEAFPFVEISKAFDVKQYENIAYTMPEYVPSLVEKAAHDAGMELKEEYSRGGTTSAMMAAKFPDAMPGGCCIYSGQNSEHTVYEWCCVEELIQLVDVVKNIVTECTMIKDVKSTSTFHEEPLPINKKTRRLPHGVD